MLAILKGTSPLSCFLGMPIFQSRFREPDRDIASIPQGVVVFLPVGYLVAGLLDLMAAFLIVFIGYTGFPNALTP